MASIVYLLQGQLLGIRLGRLERLRQQVDRQLTLFLELGDPLVLLLRNQADQFLLVRVEGAVGAVLFP